MTGIITRQRYPSCLTAKVIILFASLLLISCSARNGKVIDVRGTNRYARGFSVTDFGSFKKVEIFNPWEDAANVRFEYLLAGPAATVPDSLNKMKVIRTPVRKVICMSTSHIAFLDALGETSSIYGISGGNYVTNDKVIKAFEEGKIVDIGYGQNLNYELIIKTKPDLVLVYGIGSEVSGFVKKLEDLGIGVIIIAEYLEPLPLGKTEWIKLIAALFDKEKEADNFFNSIESDYLALRAKAGNKDSGPEVLVGTPYRDNWWVPGGNSYIANLISDAGGLYPGRKNESHESFVISFEDAMIWAQNSDFWINTGSFNSKKELLEADPRFANFRVFKEGAIFNNNRRISASGGNDFWESGTVYPNRILADLITIFHPGLNLNRELTYYREIR